MRGSPPALWFCPRHWSQTTPKTTAIWAASNSFPLPPKPTAFEGRSRHARSEILPIPQWDLPTVMADASTLPSFLYLPEEAVVTQLQGKKSGEGVWVIGRLARTRAAE